MARLTFLLTGVLAIAQLAAAAPITTSPAVTYTPFRYAKNNCIPSGYVAAQDEGQGPRTTLPGKVTNDCRQKCTDLGSQCGGYLVKYSYAADSNLATATCFFYPTIPPALQECADKPSNVTAEIKNTGTGA